jgi:hypothetical protein
MMRKLLIILVMFFIMWPMKAEEHPLQFLMEVLIQVESHGNPRAKGGNSVGILQITPIVVKECNQILREKGLKKKYTLHDRYSVEKSKEMFILIQEKHNPHNNIEHAIRLWNGGPRYTKKGTQHYYNKVIKIYGKTVF